MDEIELRIKDAEEYFAKGDGIDGPILGILRAINDKLNVEVSDLKHIVQVRSQETVKEIDELRSRLDRLEAEQKRMDEWRNAKAQVINPPFEVGV